MNETDYPLSCEDIEEDGPWFKEPSTPSRLSPQSDADLLNEETWWP